MTATWSHSRPLVAWAVARVRPASGCRRVARRARASAIAVPRSSPGARPTAQPVTAAAISASVQVGSGSGSSGVGATGLGLAEPVAAALVWGPGSRARAGAGPRATATTRAATWSGDVIELAASTRPSTRPSSRGSWTPSARNGMPDARQAATAGRSSRRVRARIARLEPSRGHEARSRGSGSVPAGVGARTSGPVAPGPARIVFAKRSSLCSTRRTARASTGAGQR